MKQSKALDNACGIIACLHIIMNHEDDISLDSKSILDKFSKETKKLDPDARAGYLQKYKDFKKVHKSFASQGQTEAPSSSDKVNHHFVAFILSSKKQLIELDGTKQGPVIIEEECKDLLKDVSKELQKRLADGAITQSLSLMAIAKRPEDSDEFAKYYKFKKDREFDKIVQSFEPDYEDIVVFPGTSKQSRMIYPADDVYEEFEEEKYEAFIQYIKGK